MKPYYWWLIAAAVLTVLYLLWKKVISPAWNRKRIKNSLEWNWDQLSKAEDVDLSEPARWVENIKYMLGALDSWKGSSERWLSDHSTSIAGIEGLAKTQHRLAAALLFATFKHEHKTVNGWSVENMVANIAGHRERAGEDPNDGELQFILSEHNAERELASFRSLTQERSGHPLWDTLSMYHDMLRYGAGAGKSSVVSDGDVLRLGYELIEEQVLKAKGGLPKGV